MMTLKETEDMQRAVDTVDRLLQMDMGKMTSSIRPESLRAEANAAMNRVLKAGGCIGDLFNFLYGLEGKDEAEAAAIAESVIALCEVRIKELTTTKQ